MRTVLAFQSSPTQQYVGVPNLTFPSPPVLPGLYQVPSYPQPFPNRQFNKAADIPFMNVQTVYNYERAGRMQF